MLFTVPPTVFHAGPGFVSCFPVFGAAGAWGTDPISAAAVAADERTDFFWLLVHPGELINGISASAATMAGTILILVFFIICEPPWLN